MSRGRNTTQRNRDRTRIKATKAACGICGDAINYSLPHTDPMSFVVDHIRPLKRGGIDHISNKQAGHALCNARKAARLVAPIVRRSGSLR